MKELSPGSSRPLGDRHAVPDYDTTIYAARYDDLNAALSDVSGNVRIVLPEGTTTFSEPISYDSANLLIEGEGKDQSVLQSDTAPRLFMTFNDNPDVSLELRDVTLDMNQVATDGRIFNIAGSRGDIILDSIRVENINLADQSTSHGIIQVNSGSVGSVYVLGDTVFRFDTFTNRQPLKYMVFRNTTGTDCYALTVGPSVVHQGTLWDGDSAYYFNGYNPRVRKYCVIDGTFIDWDQYCGITQIRERGTTVDYRATSIGAGSGDQFRIETAGEGYGNVSVSVTIENADGYGDRGFLTENACPAHVHFDGASVTNGHVPFEIRGAKLVTGNVSVLNSGHNTDAVGRPAVQINDKEGPVESVALKVNIINENPGVAPYLDPAIEVNDTGTNGISAGPHILEGVARGYETTRVGYINSADATAWNEDRLFG